MITMIAVVAAMLFTAAARPVTAATPIAASVTPVAAAAFASSAEIPTAALKTTAAVASGPAPSAHVAASHVPAAARKHIIDTPQYQRRYYCYEHQCLQGLHYFAPRAVSAPVLPGEPILRPRNGLRKSIFAAFVAFLNINVSPVTASLIFQSPNSTV